jgi:TatD family-associated radical SAM protein
MYDPSMDIAYRFGDPSRLYLNVTNRCTNRCSFCIRNNADGVGDGSLWGGPEPGLDTLLAAVEAKHGREPFREIIWCGFGEPTYRLDLITAAAPHLHRAARSIRLNTNGHASLIHGRDALPELAAAVDDVSVSLNAPNLGRYLELCRPDPGPRTPPDVFWKSMLDFLSASPSRFRSVQASVVGAVLTPDEIAASRQLARSLGVELFRVR